MKLGIATWGALALTIATNAISQQPILKLTARQNEIIRTVSSVDGYIDVELYREFWSLMPRQVNEYPDFHKYLKKMLDDVADERQTYIRESWLSAKQSFQAGRVIKTDNYERSAEAVINASDNPAYRAKAKESVASGERLISAAASRSPIDVGGQKVNITYDVIEKVLSGLDVTEARLRKLLEKTWSDRLDNFRYDNIPITILSTTPFLYEKINITASTGKVTALYKINQRPTKNSNISIGFVPVQANFADPLKSLTSIAKSAVEGVGASGKPPILLEWQGRRSAIMNGSAQTSEGGVYVSVRIVELRERGGVLQFLAASDLSAADALNTRLIFEERSNLLD